MNDEKEQQVPEVARIRGVMKPFAVKVSQAVLFAVIFICATVVLLRGLWPPSSGNLPGWTSCLASFCAATFAYRWLTVRFPGEKGAPTLRRQVEVFLMIWVPFAALLILMKLVDLGVLGVIKGKQI